MIITIISEKITGGPSGPPAIDLFFFFFLMRTPKHTPKLLDEKKLIRTMDDFY